MSKIQQALAAATEIEPSRRSGETITTQSYLKRLALGVQELSDDEWNKLDAKMQDWFNKAADAIEKNAEIPVFPDLEQPAASTRRRASTAEVKPYASTDAKVGDVVSGTTKRGKAFDGTVVTADEQGIVVNTKAGDLELDHDKIDTIALTSSDSANSADPAEPEGPADPQIGDTVKVKTARGKVIFGKVTEITDTDMVLTDGIGEIHELARDRLVEVEVKVLAQGDAPKSSRATTSASASASAPQKSTRATASANGGVSVTTRIRELIAENVNAKKDDIAASLKKEALEFKQATLDLTYGDMHKILSILRDKGLLK